MGPKEKRAALIAEARAIAEGAKGDGRDALTPEEQGKVEANLKEAGELASQLMAAQKSGELLDQLKHAESTNLEVGAKGEQTDGSQSVAAGTKSVGASFVESDGYKEMLERYPTGIPEQVVPNVTPTQFAGLKAIEEGVKTIVNVGTNTTASGNAMPTIVADNRGFLPMLFRPLTLLDLVTRGNSTSDIVEYFREIARTNNAAPVGEATATGGSTGLKPESALRFERVQDTDKTIAHWVPITRKALRNVGQIRTMVDAFLLQMLNEVLESQMLNGDGTGDNLNGIRTQATGTEAWNTDLFVTTRKALTYMRNTSLIQPTGWVLNPADMESVDLATDNANRFYGQGPFGIGPRTLWGLPVAESSTQPAGEGLLGDFRQAVLYDREQASVQVGTINDQFVRNMITLLAELVVIFSVLRPAAFRKIDLTP